MKNSNVIGLTDRKPQSRKHMLEQLLAEHGASLRAFLKVRMTRFREDREDIEHDVFARLAKMNELDRITKPGSAKARSFIIKVADNLILDHERRHKTRQKYLDEQTRHNRDEEPGTASLDEQLQARQDLERVKNVLMGMKEKWRDAFILHRFGNKSYREISAAMGVSSKQVEHYIKQAVMYLSEIDCESGRSE